MTLRHSLQVERTREAIAARVAAARSPEAELSRARIAVTRAQLDERRAQGMLDSARRSLASMWGDTEARFERAEGDLFAVPELESFDALLTQLDQNPDFVRFASQTRLRDAEVRLAEAYAHPNLAVGFGLRRHSATGDTALVAGFSIGLPVSDRNQGSIREANVRRGQSQAQELAARIRAQATLYALYSQMLVGRQQLTTLQGDALPQAQAALTQTQAGYDRGGFSYLELATAQQDLLGLRAAVIEVAADVHRLTTEIERLTSAPVTATTP